MTSMNIFNSNAFATVQLTTALSKLPYVPRLLGDLEIFAKTPTRSRTIAIERRDGFLALVPTSPIGAAPEALTNDKRDIRDFRTVRLAKGFTIYAEELNGIREFGTETELMQVQSEVARRAARVQSDLDVTAENMRLGAIQGVVTDADGSVIRNWYSEWGIDVPEMLNFELDKEGTDVSRVCKTIVRKMQRAGESVFTLDTKVHALASDEFYDALIAHPSVKQFYMNWNAAQSLRDSSAATFDTFEFGGIVWHNYRGTSDNTTVAIKPGRVAFFPVGAPDVFQTAYGPAEFEPWVNTMGQEMYALTIPDYERQAWQKFELYSYPLHICTRPEMLLTGKRQASDK